MQDSYKHLEQAAYALRYWSLIQTTQAGSGHPTSCLSAADIVAVIFFHALRFDIKNPKNPDNDRFILSKGHASALLYAAWKCAGVLQEEDLLTYRSYDSVLEGHPTMRFDYTEAATGSLGLGLSIGLGMAVARAIDQRDYYIYVLLGDNELAEGSVWEAVQLAPKRSVGKFIALVDNNRLGQSGEAVYSHEGEKYADQFRSFGWQAFTVDGHNSEELVKIIDYARHEEGDQPIAIIAHTIKGYGVSNAENKNGFHGKPFTRDKLDPILQTLRQRFHRLESDHLALFPVAMPVPFPNASAYKQGSPELAAPTFQLPLFDTLARGATRKACGQALADLGADSSVVVLDADVKNSTYTEIFEKKYPERFVQCFIAEQNMISMAVGLAARGKKPWAATFASFFSRAHDQIRMAAIGQASLCLIGSHAGVSIGADGPSQMGLEDIALMRALPNSCVLYPSDMISAYRLTMLMYRQTRGITYIRTTREETPIIYDTERSFVIGGCSILRSSSDDQACIIAAGITLHEALKAHTILEKQGIAVSVIDLYSIKPLDAATIIATARASGNRIITVEDHYHEGGLGEAVAYSIRNTGIYIDCLAVPSLPRSGNPHELLAFAGIDAHAIVSCVKAHI